MSDVKIIVEELRSANTQFQDAVTKGNKELADKIGADLLSIKDRLAAAETALARSTAADSRAEAREVSEHRKAFKSYMRSGNDVELRTVQGLVGTVADGGYAVPTVIDTNVTRLLVESSDMRSIAKVVTVGTSQYTHNISQANAAGGWVAETGSRSKTNAPTLGQVVIPTNELYANPETSLQLVEDANFDIEAWYASEVADIINRTESTAFVNGAGSGSNQPKGFLAYTTNDLGSNAPDYTKLNTFTSHSAQTLTIEDIQGAPYKILPGYRKGASWVMNRAVLQVVMTLKDSTGRPLWQPAAASGLAAGAPDTLAGYPVYEFADMPASLVGTGSPLSTPIGAVFGDFSKGYTIVDRVGLSVIRDVYTNKGFVSFYTRKRVGGGLEDGNALVGIKVKQS